MRTPFPLPQEFAEFDSIGAIPPFDVDVVFNYGGYRMDTADVHVRDQGELQYSLRSVFWNMPWFRHIFIVCPDELAEQLSASPLWPPWLDADSLSFVTPSNRKRHAIVFVAQSRLMHFDRANAVNNSNSNAFEINLHRTPGLSEHFISFCDDFFVGRPVPWTFFFAADLAADLDADADTDTDDPELELELEHAQRRGWIPRIAWSVFQKYFVIHHQEKSSNARHFATTYDCDVLQLSLPGADFSATADLPARVEKYYSHAPRALTKSLMREFVAKFPKWFRFVESHKRRWCCPPPYVDEQRPYKCDRQENLWLPLYKQYIDFELRVDIMDTAAMLSLDRERLEQLPYAVSARDLTNYYHPAFAMHTKLKRLLEIRPYTFSLNDYFSDAPYEYLHAFVLFHNFTNTYWPRPAPFERRRESIREMAWYTTALQLRRLIEKDNARTDRARDNFFFFEKSVSLFPWHN